jgi:thiol-disulfide isomerase/thioredoxin
MLIPIVLTLAFVAQAEAHNNEALAPRLVQADHGLTLSWLEKLPGPGTKKGDRAVLMVSEFDGQRWSTPESVVQHDGLFANWADLPGIAVQKNGDRYAHWLEKRTHDTYAYDIQLAYRKKGQKSWKRLGPLHSDGLAAEHGFVSTVTDKNSTLFFWLDGRKTVDKGPMTLRVARYSKGKKVWEKVVDDRVCDCCGTAATRTHDGARVVYRDRRENEVRDLATVRVGAGKLGEVTPLHRDGWQIPGCPVNGPSVASRKRATAVVWYTGADGKPAVRGGFLNEAGRVEEALTLWGDKTLGRVDVVIDDRSAIAVGLMADKEDGHLVARRFTQDGRVGEALRIGKTSADRRSGFPQAEILGDRLVVVWTDARGKTTRLRKSVFPLSDLPPASARNPTLRPEAPLPNLLRPDLKLFGMNGRTEEFATGGPSMIHLWATWCAPCLEEMPQMIEAARTLQKRGVRTFFLSVDNPSQKDRVLQLASRWQALDLVFLEEAQSAEKKLRVRTIPATPGFSAKGRLLFRAEGKTPIGAMLKVKPD